jgi:type VI secretion system secreted protein Hcp
MHEEEPATRKRPSAPVDEAAAERGLPDETLRLQELIGNANVTEAIARSPLQRDTAGTEAAPAKEGEKEEPKGVVYTMTMADIGTFELLSWSWGVSSGGSGGSGESAPGKHTVRDLTATKKADEQTAKLMQYAATGKHIATVELRTSRGGEAFVIKLKDVIVTSYQTGGSSGDDVPLETFGLSFAEIEYEFSEGKK